MELPRPATVSERIGTAMLNSFLGNLPNVLPGILMLYSSADSWGGKPSNIALLSVGLAVVQFIWVHKMQGSPGYVVAGFRVQLVSGEPPGLKISALRAVPYLVGFVGMAGLNVGAVLPSLPLIAIFAMFAAANFIILMLDGRRSLVDKTTGTEVVKSYRIFPQFRPGGAD